MMDIGSGLAGLALLGGDSRALTSATNAAVESSAVRAARAQFVLPATTPPWNAAMSAVPGGQVDAIRTMRSIIDAPLAGTRALPKDVQTAFTTWKAVDRLRLLAESAARPATTASERARLQTSFAKGLGDLEAFMGTAPSDKLQLAFAQPVRRVSSVGIGPGTGGFTVSVSGKGVVAQRDQILSHLSGTEQFRVSLERGSAVDSVVVDLASLPEPPTLDSVAALINQAIAAIPYRNAQGQVVTQPDGTPEPKWKVAFEPVKTKDGWAMSINRQGSEAISIDQVDAPDALLVAAGQTGLETPTAARVLRLDDPAGAMDRHSIATITSTDRLGGKPVATTSAAIASDAQGYGYVVGTAAGDLDGQRTAGSQDLYLSKLDSLGNVVWQRLLGAADSASGAAVSVAPDGAIVVAGTVDGQFGGASADSDMLVTRFDANGDEQFSTRIHGAGADRATSIAVSGDGAIFVGGQAAAGAGSAFVARLDGEGHVTQRQRLDGPADSSVTAMAIDGAGRLAVLRDAGGAAQLRLLDPATMTDAAPAIDLGQADARALAVGPDGTIAVAGATLAALPGDQVNALSGGRDGFVARVAPDTGQLAVTYLGSTASDQIDSLIYSGDRLYAGGRTAGALSGARRGAVDGFVARIDPASGAVERVDQFGQPTQRTEPVRLAVSAGGSDNKVAALGFARGLITPPPTPGLIDGTSLREGDAFSIRVNGGAVRTVSIGADETVQQLADRLRRIVRASGTVTTPRTAAGTSLALSPKPGNDIELIAGPAGRDALEKLGLPAARVSGMAPIAKNAPVVRPGGSFGLGLDPALSIADAKRASAALGRLKSAASIAQTGYRSLYWDDSKAALVDGSGKGKRASTAREDAQRASYQAALNRLGSPSTTIIGL